MLAQEEEEELTKTTITEIKELFIDNNNNNTEENDCEMNPFPTITHISQIKEAINNDVNDFKYLEQDNYHFYCYSRVTTETFPSLIINKSILPNKEIFSEFQNNNENLKEEETLNKKLIENYKIRREIRGLVFEKYSGKLISRSLHKFFNINENEESSLNYLENKFNVNDFIFLEKLDGSMVIPMKIILQENTLQNSNLQNSLQKEQIVFRTKRGYFNKTSNEVDNFIKNCNKNLKYLDFCNDMLNLNQIPIFEFYSKNNLIVINYGNESFLKLIAIRDLNSGKYLNYNKMLKLSKIYNLPIVKKLFENEKFNNFKNLMERINFLNQEILQTNQLAQLNNNEFLNDKELNNNELNKINKKVVIEGIVLRHFKTGEMFKLKTKEYSLQHKNKEYLLDKKAKESHFWKIILNDQLDDLLPFIEDKTKILLFNDKIWKSLDFIVNEAIKLINKSIEIVNLNIKEGKILEKDLNKEIVKYLKENSKVLEGKENYLFTKVVFRIRNEMFVKNNNSVDMLEIVKGIIINHLHNLDLVRECLNCMDINFRSII
ncbi:hypothetical protein ABK040_001932 [Willaertia magna]